MKPKVRKNLTERFRDRQETLDDGDWGSSRVDFVFDVSSSHGNNVVDGTDDIVRAGDFNQEDRLLKSWVSEELRSVEGSSGDRDDLSSTSVDTIGVQGGIKDVESDGSAGFVADGTVGGDNVETGDA